MNENIDNTYQIDTSRLLAYTKNLHFTPNSREIIYLDLYSNKRLNDFLQHNANKIEQLFAQHKYKFIYLPKFIRELNFKDILNYNYPCSKTNPDLNNLDETTQLIYQMVYKGVLTPIPNGPILVRYKFGLSNRENNLAKAYGRTPASIFSYFVLPLDATDSEYMEIFSDYISKCGEEPILYSLPHSEGSNLNLNDIVASDKEIKNNLRFQREKSKDSADGVEEIASDPKNQHRSFSIPFIGRIRKKKEIAKANEEALRIQEEIKDRVETLRKMGITELVIESLFHPTPPPVSQMRISSEYRLFLTDYDNREIKIPPLAKSLYFLYLNHPEGIRFKELTDHQQELRQYYQTISNRINQFKLISSIDDLVDSTKNSVNEKCSIIRSAFLNEFDESIVNPYLITSGFDIIKKIPFDRSLLVDDAHILLRML